MENKYLEAAITDCSKDLIHTFRFHPEQAEEIIPVYRELIEASSNEYVYDHLKEMQTFAKFKNRQEEGKLFFRQVEGYSYEYPEIEFPENIAITGNRYLNDHIGIPEWETMLEYFDYPDDIENPELSKFFTELGDNPRLSWDEKYVAGLTKITGKKFECMTLRGLSQSDWNTLYYQEDEWSEKSLNRFEAEYFGLFQTVEVRMGGEDTISVADLYFWEPIEEQLSELFDIDINSVYEDSDAVDMK